jgi:thiol-disulfide isomerase/thioredoxin
MMKYNGIFYVCISLLILAIPIHGAEDNNAISLSSLPKSQLVNDLYPNLEAGILTYAAAADLPDGILLKAGDLVINDKDVNSEIAKANAQMQLQLKKNAICILGDIATLKLILAEAKAEAAKNNSNILKKDESAIIEDYLVTLAKDVKVTDAEIKDFYNNNKDSLGGATLAQDRPTIEKMVIQEKQQKRVDEYIRTIGQRTRIEISASWLKAQAVLAMDNPVNKARDSGIPTLVDFGSKGCVPCDMLAPILETLREKYKGKANVVFVHVGQEPILARRYGVETIPLQIFYDKTGKEVFRHVGFFPQKEIENKLSEIGVK